MEQVLYGLLDLNDAGTFAIATPGERVARGDEDDRDDHAEKDVESEIHVFEVPRDVLDDSRGGPSGWFENTQ